MIARLLERLEDVRRTGSGRWLARCPAHDDSSPSLSIREAGDGRILLHDFGGCDPVVVLAAVGLELRDLFPAGDRAPGSGWAPAPHRARRVDPADLLAVLDREAIVLGVVGGWMLEHRELPPAAWEDLEAAVGRIAHVRGAGRAAGWVR